MCNADFGQQVLGAWCTCVTSPEPAKYTNWLIDWLIYVRVLIETRSQRDSAWHYFIGRLLSEGKMLFSTSRPEKPIIILEPNLSSEITSVRSTNSQNLVQIICEMAPSRGGEINGFVTFYSRLFSFFFVSSARPQVAIWVRFAGLMAQKTCSDWYTCLFRVWCLQIHYEGSPT